MTLLSNIENLIGIESPADLANVSRSSRMRYNSNDKSTLVNYSIMLYYTREVRDNVADLDGFFEQVLAETNQGKTIICTCAIFNIII